MRTRPKNRIRKFNVSKGWGQILSYPEDRRP